MAASNETTTKVCTRCKLELPIDSFALNGRPAGSSGTGAYRQSACRECRQTIDRVGRLRRLFGLEEGEYEKLLEAQGGVCYTCKRPPVKNRLAVDHDHKTGLTRGLLCYRCNRMLGWVYDNADALEAGADYLRNPPAVRILGREAYGRKGRVDKRSKRNLMSKRQKQQAKTKENA